MQFRHEVKHEISQLDMLVLRTRLRAIMSVDKHAENGCYEIRSLYFDSFDDKALREKLDGVNKREKYRIRMYNNNIDYINLERKFKYNSLGYKDIAYLSKNETEAIINGDISWMKDSKDNVILGFYNRLRYESLKPKVIVDYIREPFVFTAGNVRVTLDYNIRTSMSSIDFLNPNALTIPVENSPCILEVKWDNYLPDIIRDTVRLENRESTAYSKYAASRMFD